MIIFLNGSYKNLGNDTQKRNINSWKSVSINTISLCLRIPIQIMDSKKYLQIQIFGGKKEFWGLWMTVPPSLFSWLDSLSYHLLIHLKRG